MLIFFMMCPIFEWAIHYLLHTFNNTNHHIHHKEVLDNKFDNFKQLDKLEILPPLIITISYIFEYWYIVIFLTRYYITHSLIHYSNIDIQYFKDLKKHHMIHHKLKKYNYAVSGVFPDYIFNTIYK